MLISRLLFLSARGNKAKKSPLTSYGCGLQTAMDADVLNGAKVRATEVQVTSRNKTKIQSVEKFIFQKYPLLYPLSANLLSIVSAAHQNDGAGCSAVKEQAEACCPVNKADIPGSSKYGEGKDRPPARCAGADVFSGNVKEATQARTAFGIYCRVFRSKRHKWPEIRF